MNPQRKKRLLLIAGLLVGVGVAVGFALSALQQNINLFYTPTQIANGEAPLDTRIRAGGMVEKGSVQRSSDSLDVRFVVTDFNKSVPIKCWPSMTRNTCRPRLPRPSRKAARQPLAGGASHERRTGDT